MKKTNLIFSLLFIISSNLFYSQSKLNQERIGIIFKFEGPYKINREAVFNLTSASNNLDPNDKYYDALNFLNNPKANPIEKLKECYINTMKLRGIDLVVVTENLNENNFLISSSKSRKEFDFDITSLKNKYNLDKVLIVIGGYGLEYEDLGDKRTTIFLNNFIINTTNNEIVKKFYIGNIKNIKKKNLINPPDYPNIVNSMNRLLDERILPKIKSKLENL